MTYRPHLSLSPQLRQASQNEADELVRFKLRGVADELDAALLALFEAPTADSLSQVVGLWARGKCVLNTAGANTHLTRNP